MATTKASKDVIADIFVENDGGTMTGSLSFQPGNPIFAGAGSLAAPSYAFSGDINTGLTQIGVADEIHLVTNGTSRLQIESNGTLSVAGTTNYEALVLAEDDVPNKKYVDDSVVDGAGQRNVIINGNFDVWQRGTAFVGAANDTWLADCFRLAYNTTAVHNVGLSGIVPTFAESGIKSNYSMYMQVTTADTSIAVGEYSTLMYKMEGYDYARIAGGDATLSFWVRSSYTGIHCVSLRNAGSDRSYVKEYTIATANIYQKIELTFPLTETGGTWDYLNGRGIDIFFTQACGSTYQTTPDAWQTGNYLATSNQINGLATVSSVVRIAQIQFEKGSVATPFKLTHYIAELKRCERYYQIIFNHFWCGKVTSGNTYYEIAQLRTQMRASPTAVLTNVGQSGFPTTPVLWSTSDKMVGTSRVANATLSRGYNYQHLYLSSKIG